MVFDSSTKVGNKVLALFHWGGTKP